MMTWFSTGIGFPSLDWHRAHAARLAAAADDLRSVGILPSIEIQAIIGHGDPITRYRDDFAGKTWRGWTGPDGNEAAFCSCPTDPELIRYFEEVGRLYAAWHPASLWFDDDIAIRSRIPWGLAGTYSPDSSRPRYRSYSSATCTGSSFLLSGSGSVVESPLCQLTVISQL